MSNRIDFERRSSFDDYHPDSSIDPSPNNAGAAHRDEAVLDLGGDGPRHDARPATGWAPRTGVLGFQAKLAHGDDRGAAQELNGLDMSDMLKVLDGLAPSKRRELLAAASQHRAELGIERMMYAREVVEVHVLPVQVPGDLKTTGQVGAAADFIADKLMEVARAANADARPHIRGLLLALNEAGEANPDHIAYVLATAHHESNLGRYMTELASGRSYEGRKDLGNTEQGDGVLFKGRGYVQITGRAHYARYSRITGADLVAAPNLAAEPSNAATIAVHGMINGAFTGKKLSDYDQKAGGFDFVHARQIVNGMDRADVIAGYAARYRGLMGP